MRYLHYIICTEISVESESVKSTIISCSYITFQSDNFEQNITNK